MNCSTYSRCCRLSDWWLQFCLKCWVFKVLWEISCHSSLCYWNFCKILFELPGKWNVHLFKLTLACDVFRCFRCFSHRKIVVYRNFMGMEPYNSYIIHLVFYRPCFFSWGVTLIFHGSLQAWCQVFFTVWAVFFYRNV